MEHTVALFGEATKGEFHTGYLCSSLPELADLFGEPPAMSQGLLFAVQTLMFEQRVVFFRVKEEGYSVSDYIHGLRVLKNREAIPSLTAVCLPGVGSKEIIEATTPLCMKRKSLLILSEKDLYDYLTE